MIPFLLYIIKLSCCLTLFYAGYKVLLSNETFFHFNRRILQTGLLVCMLLPLVTVRTSSVGVIQQPMMQLEKMMHAGEQTRSYSVVIEADNHVRQAGDEQKPSVSFVHVLVLLFAAGSMVNLCFLIRSHILLSRLIRKGRKIYRTGYTVVLFDRPVTPFNYRHYIVLSEKDYSENPDTIVTHELAHFWYSHAFDIALMECMYLLQWFNPVVRLLKKELQKVHEFQADAEVLRKGFDITKYQLLLAQKTVDAGTYAFVNSFNHSKLKNRFTMMTQKKSNRWARLKLILLLPVVALIVYAFARPYAARQIEQMMRSEDATILADNQTNRHKFFEDEQNEYYVEIEVNSLAPENEKLGFLFNSTEYPALYIDALGVDDASVEKLSSGLIKMLSDEYPDKKPVYVFLCQHKKTDLYTVKIKACPDTPMGIITDVRESFSHPAYRVEYEVVN